MISGHRSMAKLTASWSECATHPNQTTGVDATWEFLGLLDISPALFIALALSEVIENSQWPATDLQRLYLANRLTVYGGIQTHTAIILGASAVIAMLDRYNLVFF